MKETSKSESANLGWGDTRPSLSRGRDAVEERQVALQWIHQRHMLNLPKLHSIHDLFFGLFHLKKYLVTVT